MSSHSPTNTSTESDIVRFPSKDSSSAFARGRLAFLVDKFFLVGALSSFFGGAGIGAHLWLMLNAQMPVAANYATLRVLHALIQTYLFFGLFILGFLFQTAPKILKVPIRLNFIFLFAIPLLSFGVYVATVWPERRIGAILIALPFFSAFLYVAYLTYRGSPQFRENYAWWVLLSLLGLSASSFFPVANPENAQMFIWSGVAPVTFAAGQQFLFAFLGGRRLEKVPNRVLFAVYLLTLGAMFGARSRGDASLWQLGGVLAFSSLTYYLMNTRILAAIPKLFRDPLAFAFLTGYMWALFATWTLAMYGPQALDGSFHMLTLGWLTPLIIAISSQVLRAIGGNFWLSPRMLTVLLIIWQLVPLGRGLRFLLPLPPSFSIVVITDVTVVLLAWLISICLSAVKIGYREIHRQARAM